MPEFRYSAVGADGQAVKGTVDAMSAAGVENELLLRGLSGIKVRERKSFGQIEITKERVPKQDIMHFSRQLAAFIRTGIPINEALRVVSDGVENKRFRAILFQIEESLQAGIPLAQAVAEHSEVFPPYYVSILRSAEMTGQLDTVLDQLSLYIERDLEARSKVKSALTYPAVIMVMSVITMLVMVLFVLPRFVDFFEDLDSELPLPTRMLLGFADFMGSWFWLIGIIVILLGLGYWLSGKTEDGLYYRHKVFLSLPLIGDIVQYSVVERFCRVIGAMMRAGVPLPDAMASATESANNKVFERGLLQAREEMIQGDGIAGPIAATGLFPNAALQMIRVGEETGTLDQQVESAAEFYARELEYKLKKLTTLFEPAVILFMGFIVGFVAVALISAMYGVLQGQEVTD
jgi:type IV pilus assembly protein PilC